MTTPRLPDDLAVHDLMDRAVRDTHSPVSATAVLAAGRVVRRRHRSYAAAGGLVATAAAAALVVVLVPGGEAPTPRGFDVAAGTASTAPTTQAPPPTTAPEPTRPAMFTEEEWAQLSPAWQAYFAATEDVPAWADRTVAEIGDRLSPLLPEGVKILGSAPDTAPGQRGSATLILANEAGEQGRLALDLRFVSAIPAPGDSVTVTSTNDNGDAGESTYVVDNTPPSSGADTYGPVTGITAVAARDDGWVSLSTANTLDEKWGPDSTPSAAAPLLTAVQAQAIVEDPSWRQ